MSWEKAPSDICRHSNFRSACKFTQFADAQADMELHCEQMYKGAFRLTVLIQSHRDLKQQQESVVFCKQKYHVFKRKRVYTCCVQQCVEDSYVLNHYTMKINSIHLSYLKVSGELYIT